MSEPPKKKLRQSTIGESFEKQSSMEKKNKDSKVESNSNESREEPREKAGLAAEKRREQNSPNVTPTHEPKYEEGLEDIEKNGATKSSPSSHTRSQNTKNSSNKSPEKAQSAEKNSAPKQKTKDINDDPKNVAGPSSEKPAAGVTDELDMTDSQGSAMSLTEEEKQGFYDEESMEMLLAEEAELQSQTSKVDKSPSKGTPKTELKTSPSCSGRLKPLSSVAGDKYHTVLFDPHTLKPNTGNPAKPRSQHYNDKWDNYHVKLPCSAENLYPVQGKGGKKEIKNRWEVIEEALLNNIMTTQDLEDAIKSYNTRYAQKWDFSGLHAFFNEVMEVEEREEFFVNLLPEMKALALRMPVLCTQGIPLLRRHYKHTVIFTQEQLACIIANAFFCTFPRRNAHGKASEYSSYPDINFNQLFVGSRNGISATKAEKLKCVLHYFKRVTKKMPAGTVSFRRQIIDKFPDWENCHERLGRLHVSAQGNIEDDGDGMLQVDFANKYLGGGVLGYGCVQEEIRFLLCPEMIAGRLITEVLEKDECLIMTGTERFSNYTGYGNTFRWSGNHEDPSARDEWGRLYVEVVAIDALVFRSHTEQFYRSYVVRELNKAYCGFSSPGTAEKHMAAVATGNWGCGVFGGDHRLKALLQIMSAAAAKRDVCFFTFQDSTLRDDLYDVHTFISKKNLSVSDLFAMINMYERYLHKRRHSKQSTQQDLFQFIYRTYTDSGGETDTTDEASSHGSKSPGEDYWGKNQPSPDYSANTP